VSKKHRYNLLISENLFQRLQLQAERKGETVAHVMRDAIRRGLRDMETGDNQSSDKGPVAKTERKSLGRVQDSI
jgi:hypothetical protein